MKALVGRLEGRPFAILGINSDPKPKLLEVLKEEGIPWRQAVEETTSGPIASAWNVRGWPTIYVLDARGVIRFKNPRGEKLGEAVDALLKEME